MGPAPTDPAAPMLRVDRLTKRFGGLTAVDGVSFQVPRGGIAALIGPQRSREDHDVQPAHGFMRTDAGTIVFDGEDVTGMSPHRLAARGLVRTFQTARMFPSMTVLEIVATAAMVKDHRRPAYETARRGDVPARLERLAPGTRRRALATGPPDPTAGTRGVVGGVVVIIDPSCQLNRAGVAGRLHRNSDSPRVRAWR